MFNGKFKCNSIATFVILTLFGYMLYPVVTGAAGGVLFYIKMSDPVFEEKMMALGSRQTQGSINKLEFKRETRSVLNDRLSNTERIFYLISINAIVFSILGLIAGIFSKQPKYSCLVLLSMLYFTLKTLKVEYIMPLNKGFMLPFVLFIQLLFLYSLGYIGSRLSNRSNPNI